MHGLQAVEEQYPAEKGYKIVCHKEFKFTECETKPYAHLKITVPEDDRYYIVGIEPENAEVCDFKLIVTGSICSTLILLLLLLLLLLLSRLKLLKLISGG